jgi:hypothetical protein
MNHYTIHIYSSISYIYYYYTRLFLRGGRESWRGISLSPYIIRYTSKEYPEEANLLEWANKNN